MLLGAIDLEEQRSYLEVLLTGIDNAPKGIEEDKKMKKVEEEIQELQVEIQNSKLELDAKPTAIGEQTAHPKIEEEFGDLLFSLVNYGRFLNIDPETALERTNQKFLKRFRHIETVAMSQGKQLSVMTLGEMDAIWNEAKKL